MTSRDCILDTGVRPELGEGAFVGQGHGFVDAYFEVTADEVDIFLANALSVLEVNFGNSAVPAYLVLLVGKFHLVFVHAPLDALKCVQ